MNKRLVITVVACAVVFGGIFGFKWFRSRMINQYLNQMVEQRVPTVSATEATTDKWALVLEAVGTVKAINGIKVTSEVPGVVQSIRFQSSTRAEDGEILVQLRDESDRARLRALEAKAAEAQSDFKRVRRLFQQNNLSESEYDLARSQLAQARANAQAQREEVEKRTIRAPFAGQLGIRQVDIGEFVEPGTPLVTLQQINPIYINFSLPGEKMNLVDQGQNVRASLSAYPEQTFEGSITAVEPAVDPGTRNFNIQATFDNAGGKLRPGMFAEVTVRRPQSEEVVVVPRTAISFNPYGDSVYVIQEKQSEDGGASDGKSQDKPELIVQRRFVETGRVRGTMIAVTEGLKPGERVATSGLLKLRNNARVTINNEVQPPRNTSPTPDNS